MHVRNPHLPSVLVKTLSSGLLLDILQRREPLVQTVIPGISATCGCEVFAVDRPIAHVVPGLARAWSTHCQLFRSIGYNIYAPFNEKVSSNTCWHFSPSGAVRLSSCRAVSNGVEMLKWFSSAPAMLDRGKAESRP